MDSQAFRVVKEGVRADSRGRFTLGSAAQAKSYRVMVNDMGQILLDPIVSIPERELWLWQNSEALAAVQRGLQQAASGEVHHVGSFAEFTELETED